jgi:hypothetical protein
VSYQQNVLLHIIFCTVGIRIAYADPDTAFHFSADPDPAPHQSNGNLRSLVCTPLKYNAFSDPQP